MSEHANNRADDLPPGPASSSPQDELAAEAATHHAFEEAVPLAGLPDLGVAEAFEQTEATEQADADVPAADLPGVPAAGVPATDLPYAAAVPYATVPGAARVGEPAVLVLTEDAAGDGAAEAPVRSLVLEKKHPVAIRWMHWVNFPVLFTMIWSGLLIYWNDSDNAYQHPHRVYRIGLGSWTLFRFFPDWFYNKLDVPFQVTRGLGYHFFFMWFFAINGILYVAYLLWSKEYRFMIPHRESLKEAIQVTLVDLHLRKHLPEQTKYNAAQRIAYSSVVLMGFGSLVTGLAIYKPTSAHWLTTLLGGYEMARWLHFLLTLAFCAFFLVHVWQVVMAGWNNFRSMVSGFELRRTEEPSIEATRAGYRSQL